MAYGLRCLTRPAAVKLRANVVEIHLEKKQWSPYLPMVEVRRDYPFKGIPKEVDGDASLFTYLDALARRMEAHACTGPGFDNVGPVPVQRGAYVFSSHVMTTRRFCVFQ